MPISDQELSNLYENFKEYEESEGEEFTEERKTKKNFFQEKLARENIYNLSEGDVRGIIKKLWAFQIWTGKDYLVEEMLRDGIKNLKNKLQTALHDSQKVMLIISKPVVSTSVVLTGSNPNLEVRGDRW